MNRPGVGVRFAGSPVGALMLFTLYGAVGYCWWWGWQGQHVRWWVALCAAAAAVRTLKAIVRVRRYKAWLAEFQAIAAEDPSRRQKRSGRRWPSLVGAVALFVAIPVCLPQIQSNGALPYREQLVTALTLLWCLAGLILAWKFLRLCWRVVRRSAAKSAERRRVEAENAPVAWLVGVPSSSPSRAEAERALPEYCARLLEQAKGATEPR
jgi:hypothetical protein